MNHLLLILLLSLSSFFSVTTGEETSSKTHYLKEIIQGRCYDNPPTTTGNKNDVDNCPTIVGSLMNILESNLDSTIQPTHFQSYFSHANFTSPTDHAVFFIRFWGNDGQKFVSPPSFVTPEETPGGALFTNLVFCGIDQQNNCNIENSKAYWTFWETAYATFAKQVTGHLQIVFENELSDVQFLIRSAINNLQTSNINSVTIYEGNHDCDALSNNIAMLTNALEDVGIDKEKIIACKGDIVNFFIDNAPPVSKDDKRIDDQEDQDKNSTDKDQNTDDKSVDDDSDSFDVYHSEKSYLFQFVLAHLVTGGIMILLYNVCKRKGYCEEKTRCYWYQKFFTSFCSLKEQVKGSLYQVQNYLLSKWHGYTNNTMNTGDDDLDDDVEEKVTGENSPLITHSQNMDKSSQSYLDPSSQ